MRAQRRETHLDDFLGPLARMQHGAPSTLAMRIDQLTDGTYRVMPKAVPGASTPMALSAVGSSKPTLATFRPDGDRERWIFKKP
jgi:arabinan endo-1,5-alpha-L-arabinosidase